MDSGSLNKRREERRCPAGCVPGRPLTAGEVARLNEEFIVEYTYNSNAIEGNTLTLRETDLVLRGLTMEQKPLKDHLEAVGHKEAFDFVDSNTCSCRDARYRESNEKICDEI